MSESDTTPAIMHQTLLGFYQQKFPAGVVPAILQANGTTVQLFETDPQTAKVSREVFSLPLSEITQTRFNVNIFQLKSADKTYMMDFAPLADSAMMAGAAGVIASSQMIKQSDMSWWIDYFKQHNVTVKEFSYGKSVKLGLILAAVIVIAAVIYAVVSVGLK